CLVLDFAGNIDRHGPVDRVVVVKRTNPVTGEGEGSVSTAPVKTCPSCRTVCRTSLRECPECGHVFVDAHTPKHDVVASSSPIMSTGRPERLEVRNVDYRRHERGIAPSLRVVYSCG